MIACPTPDGGVWIAENNPRRLKKADLLRKEIQYEIQTNIGDSIRFMRMHQNIMVIADENGIHVFDQFGSQQHFLGMKGVHYFQIVNNKLAFCAGNQYLNYDPYTGVITKSLSLNPGLSTQVILKLKHQYLMIGERIDLYQLIE